MNEVREFRIYLEEEMEAANCVERWAVRFFAALVAVAVIALFVVANWQRLQMLFAA